MNVMGMHVVALGRVGMVMSGAEDVMAGCIEDCVEVLVEGMVTVVSEVIVDVTETTRFPPGDPPLSVAKTGRRNSRISPVMLLQSISSRIMQSNNRWWTTQKDG